MKKLIWTALLILPVLQAAGLGDTFRHKTKDITYHGYLKQATTPGGKCIIVTPDQEQVEINTAEYDIEYNAEGRVNFISLLEIKDVIGSDFETKVFEEAILEEADKGPLFILIEIDTPGGDVELCKRLCAAVTGLQYCPTYAYITGGQSGGAFSAGAAVSLACDKIYMAPASNIGAATSIVVTEDGEVADLKEAYGETVGEKYSSAWRSYFASLAQQNDHSGAIARAMVDKDISVIEVQRNGQSQYVETKDKRPSDVLVRTLCNSGELLTLSAQEAVGCNIAAAVAENRQELLSLEGVTNVKVIPSPKMVESKEEFEKVVRRFNKLVERLDLKFKELQAKAGSRSLTRSQALRDYDAIIKNAEYILRLKRSYPDIPYEEETLISVINSLKADQAAIKSMR